MTADKITRGAVVINGRAIEAVGEAEGLVQRYPNATIIDHGEAVILPGFVNCHSHLELNSFRGALDNVEHDFRSWLLRLNQLRSQTPLKTIEKEALRGAEEGARAGVTCFGDIGRIGHAGVQALLGIGLRGIVFQETEFSPDDRTAEKDFAELALKFERLLERQSDLVKIGISPHSPYTVSPKLLKLIADHSLTNDIPISIHTSESRSETELMSLGKGFFVDIYRKFGLEWSSPGCSSIEYLEGMGFLSARPVLAHCVHVSENDIAKIAHSGASIALCPKSNAKFGHGIAPLESFLNAGISVGLGSDSVASNNICDMLEEARFAVLTARNRDNATQFISAEEILRLATLGGAQTLGLERYIGSLEPGKEADIIVIGLDALAQQPINDVYSAVAFSSNACDVKMTMVAGKVVYSD